MTDRENPFLIPPPPASVTAKDDEPAASAPPSRVDPDVEPLISLPPGLVDSATLRGAQRTPRRTVAPPAEPVRRSNDEIVFFPGAPGVAPIPDVAPEDATVVRTPSPEFSDATVARAPRAAWHLVLPDGRTVSMPTRLLLGRNPAAVDGWTDAELLPLVDPTKSVSKTHAALELDGDELWVHDLASTNGVWISGAAGIEERRVTPGTRASVPADADVELGELVIRVQRPG